MSPVDSSLLYSGRLGESQQLFRRALPVQEPVPLAGTDGATSPLVSPDGAWIAFFSENELRRIPAEGGPASKITDARSPRGATWVDAERLVLAPEAAGALVQVGMAGGAVEPLTTLDPERGEKSHRWPSALPGGELLLLTVWRGDERFDIDLVEIASGQRTTLIEDASDARYVPTGHVVFARDGALHAVGFDAPGREVQGTETRVLERVGVDPLTGAALYAIDPNGWLFYAESPAATAGTTALLLVDRMGRPTRLTDTGRELQLPRLSPDGRRVLVTIDDGDKSDVWVLELERGTLTRLTFDSNNAAGVWSRVGDRVIFSSDRDGVFNLYEKAADGSDAAVRLTDSPYPQIPNAVSPDGARFAYTEFDMTNGFDLWMMQRSDGVGEVLLETSYDEIGGAISPDGGLLAYVSNETGDSQVYVRDLSSGTKLQVSVDGGSEPVWHPTRPELFFRAQQWIASAMIELGPPLRAERPALLFETPYVEADASYTNFDVTADDRFVMVQSALESTTTQLHVVTGWFEELARLVPTP